MLQLILALVALQTETAPEPALEARIDAYIDARWDAGPGATAELAEAIRDAGHGAPEAWEALLRDRRASYPALDDEVGAITWHEIECAHVDYASRYALWVPEDYDPSEAYALVVVGHGGNSSMSADRAGSTARQYLEIYRDGLGDSMRAVLVAPASERGWGPIGYSLVFSTISHVQRKVPIDPDRIFVTGQSMGGHLAYRIGLLFGDRFGAVSPHSGGYDFVEKSSIANLLAVPGMSIFGSSEPYGINGDNKTNEKWLEKHGFDWAFSEEDGGHTIYKGRLPDMGEFFNDRPRNAYPTEVYLRQGGTLRFEKTWNIDGWPEHVVDFEARPLRWNRRHWLEVEPNPEAGEPIEVHATLDRKGNRIELTSNNLRRATLRLHPAMLDLEDEIEVRANGKTVFEGRVEPDLEGALERARLDDDRGRVYWASVEIEVRGDRAVKLPRRRAE